MTMRILVLSGQEVGRVKGRSSLVSEDECLVQIWNDVVAPPIVPSPQMNSLDSAARYSSPMDTGSRYSMNKIYSCTD